MASSSFSNIVVVIAAGVLGNVIGLWSDTAEPGIRHHSSRVCDTYAAGYVCCRRGECCVCLSVVGRHVIFEADNQPLAHTCRNTCLTYPCSCILRHMRFYVRMYMHACIYTRGITYKHETR